LRERGKYIPFRRQLLAGCVPLRKGRKRERGASLVEYAFIFIIFLTLIFGIGGFGHALFVYHTLNEAAKEATRYAVVRGSTCGSDLSCIASNSASGTSGPTSQADLTSYVTSIIPPSIDTAKVIATATWPGPASPPICFHDVTLPNGTVVTKKPDNYPGCTVSVQVSYPYNFIFPFLPGATTTTAPCTVAGICMSSASEMVIAH
jgi:Flp pilus assembly protein TadG